MTDFKTKDELLTALRETNEKVANWFESISARNFFARQEETWSASDNLDHLVRSHNPVIKALQLPRIVLQKMFGRPIREPMSYEALCAQYRHEIAKGAAASGIYLPDQQSPGDPEAKKRESLEIWSSTSAGLVTQVEKWEEQKLDLYQLPHPILGNLTIREILYFTIYHNLRHASLDGD